MNFWAKTTQEGKPGIAVYEHMINVGCVACCIAEAAPELLKRFELPSSVVGALAALHDLGKISPGFQRKCEQWLINNNLVQVSQRGVWDTGTEADHGRVTHAAVQEFLTQQGIARSSAKYLAAILGGHHGRIKHLPNDRGITWNQIGPITEQQSNIDWNAERLQCAQQIWRYFDVHDRLDMLDDESPALWWLAGLTSVADWIGSDERFFSPVETGVTTNNSAIARKALDMIGLKMPAITPNLTFEQIFGFPPNDMQMKTLATIQAPGVYVIEAPMGMGKTEAALGAAYQLLASGKASGIYFALPTQATSNRIHLRMNEFLERIAPAAGSSRLIHANSWLMRDDAEYRPARSGKSTKPDEDARNGRDWFASTKRALLAPFGVGTIDQALLGVVAVKHFFVRHFALAGKVVILDEVHSYDVYTGTLIDKLIETLEGLGCTVIVLSATLTGRRRDQIISGWEGGDGVANQAYPLISGRTEKEPLEPIAATPPSQKTVNVQFVSIAHAMNEAIDVARKGGAVLWICNTVGVAQKQFDMLRQHVNSAFKVGLLHSHMIFSHREAREREWMERFGKNGSTRCGSILVSTQVVEQSVDLDADLMITELAPTDMLLQRLGRLWRHERRNRPVEVPRVCILEEDKTLDEFRSMSTKEIIAALGKKAKVYDPYALLRSFEAWQGRQCISVPGDIRSMLDMTYAQNEQEPDAWSKLYDETYAKTLAYRQRALTCSNIWQAAIDDQEGKQTRLNELRTVSLILCREVLVSGVHFIDDAVVTLPKDDYSFAVAKAVHMNLVKAPEYHFEGLAKETIFSEYLYEPHATGLINDDGTIFVKGLKDGVAMSYDDEMGLVIIKR